MSRKKKECVPNDEAKGAYLLGTKPWSKKFTQNKPTRRKAAVYHNKAKKTERMTNFKPYRPNGKTLHLTEEPLERGDIEKNPKTQKLANRYHSMKRCESYQRARRAFDQKANEPWKTIYRNKHLCKWRKFFQRQKIIKFRQLNEEKNAGVTAAEWKTDAWIPKLQPYFTPELTPDYIPTEADDTLCEDQKLHPERYVLDDHHKDLDDSSVQDKCVKEYNPYGGFVDAEDTIPLLYHTDYGFAKSNASLVKILRKVDTIISEIKTTIDYYPRLMKYKFLEIVGEKTLISMVKEPFRKKLVSHDYDINPEPDYELSENDGTSIFQLMFNILGFYFYKSFCDWLLKKIKAKMAKKTKTVKNMFQAKYALLTNTVQARLFHELGMNSEGSNRNLFLDQSQYLVWGQYDIHVEDESFFEPIFDEILQTFFLPNYLDDDVPVDPPGAAAAPRTPSPPRTPPRVMVPV
jgi:hypothetical protein